MAGRPAVINQAVEGEVLGAGIKVMSASEYHDYSKANGRHMGRENGEKTLLTSEEFVVLHKAGWSPRNMMDKHGIDLAELQQVAMGVGLFMQLKRPISVTEKSIKF